LRKAVENLAYVAKLLDSNPNLSIDISARTPELGRQPYTAREFLIKYADRIIFGTDLLPDVEMYRLYYRVLETADEYFDYPSHASRQGRWMVYGLFLPADVLQKVYRGQCAQASSRQLPLGLFTLTVASRIGASAQRSAWTQVGRHRLDKCWFNLQRGCEWASTNPITAVRTSAKRFASRHSLP